MIQELEKEKLDNIIKDNNPFNRALIVTKQDIWQKNFPDFPGLNSHASDGVFQAIEEIKNNQRKLIGITIQAEKGLGKSHLISRIRHQLKQDSKGWFVYMTDYNNLNEIKSEILNALAMSLKKNGSREVSQWQELATYLINEALNKNHSPKQVTKNFSNHPDRIPDAVETLTNKILEVKTDIDNPYLIKAIIWTFSPSHLPFAVNWIAGKGLSIEKAKEMKLPTSSNDSLATKSFERVCQIFDLMSDYKPLLICFDQLEGRESSDNGYTKAQVIANLGMDLFNSIKSAVILTTVYRDIWVQQINSLPNAEAVIDRIGEKQFQLKFLNGDDIIGLVSCWLKGFYEEHKITPPSPIYPFSESKLRELGKQKASARDVLEWCRNNWKIPPESGNGGKNLPKPSDNPNNGNGKNGFIIPEEILEKIKLAFEKELEKIAYDIIDNKPVLANAIYFAFQYLIGKTIENITIENIELINSRQSKYLDFKIIAKENGETLKIGVMILQVDNTNSVSARLKHLINYQEYDINCGCLIRSKDISKRATKAHECLNILKNQQGKWVYFQLEEIQSLLAIKSIFDNKNEYNLTEEEIFSFIKDESLITKNQLILNILKNPSLETKEISSKEISKEENNNFLKQEEQIINEFNIEEDYLNINNNGKQKYKESQKIEKDKISQNIEEIIAKFNLR